MEKPTYVCDACNLQLPENNKTSHESGKKHRNNLKRLGQDVPLPPPPIHVKKKIVVRGYPGYTQPQDLVKVFSTFGPVVAEKTSKLCAILRFENESVRDQAVTGSGKIVLYGSFLKVQPYTEEDSNDNKGNKREFPNSKQKEYTVHPKSIDFSGDFTQQCNAIFAAVRLSREEVEKISMLYTHLTEVLQYLWPGCVAVPFGSITTGLGIKSSDADCFIDIPPRFRDGSYVNRAKKRLAYFPKVFSEILAIPRANTPIVKFFHIPTETNCDISFKTPLGARNSALIAFLLRGDPRILQLSILVKYWAKVHNLTGTGRLSNYALTMLVVFYLQQQPTPLLPSIQWLQRDLGCFIDGWNTAFADQFPLAPPVPNPLSLAQLLGGFFKFYASFDFPASLICPFLGVAVPKNNFKKIEDIPDDFSVYKSMVVKQNTKPIILNSDMSIQDPFEHSRNVASSVGFRLFNEIKQSLEWASQLYEKDTTNSCEIFLKSILLDKPKIRQVLNTKFKLYIQFSAVKHLPEAVWKEKVTEKFYVVFEELLKFEITKLESPPEDNKGEKVVHYREYYRCKSTCVVWRRKQMGKLYDAMEMDFLSKQKRITEDLVKVDKSKHKLSMLVEIELMFIKCPRHAIILLKWDNDGQNHFEEFGRFCVSTVSLWFIELFKMDTKKLKAGPNSAKKDKETSVEVDSGLVDNENAEAESEPVEDDNLEVNSEPVEDDNLESNSEPVEDDNLESNSEPVEDDKVDVDTEPAQIDNTVGPVDDENAVIGQNGRGDTMSRNQDIPKLKADFTDGNDSSPENPPLKMFKKQ